MMDHSQNKKVVAALNVEDAVRKPPEVGAPNGFEDDGKARRE